MKTIKVKDLISYGKLVSKLAEQIKKSGKVYKAVYSPDNPMLAFLLSKKLGIELHSHPESMKSILKMTYIGKEFLKCMEPESTLIVSDIINTGNTREKYKDFDFACLFQVYKLPSTLYLRTLVGKWLKINTKVIMPWEKEIK